MENTSDLYQAVNYQAQQAQFLISIQSKYMDCFTLDRDNSIYPSATLFASVWFVGKLGKQDQNLLYEILKLSEGLGKALSKDRYLDLGCSVKSGQEKISPAAKV